MKIYTFLLLLFICAFSNGQVGINTSEPEADLDVNGSLRVRRLVDSTATSNATATAVKLVGVDVNGNLVPVSMGENVKMRGNSIIATKQKLSFGDLPILSIPSGGRMDNLNIVIFPGERNEGKSIIRITIPSPPSGPSGSDIKITGIKAAPDGTQIWLYPTDGEIELTALDANSIPENQIQDNSHMSCKQYEMMRLVYDGWSQKWVIMKHHGG